MQSPLANVEVVLFDAVGTLIHPQPSFLEVYQLAGRRYGVSLATDKIAARFRAAFAEAFRPGETSQALEVARWRQVVATVFRQTGAPVDEVFAELWSHFGRSESWALYPDVAPVWRELERRGYRLGIASNFDDRLPAVLAGLPPLDACSHAFWSSRVGFAKPDPRFFAHVAQTLATPANKILLVGDDWENDIVGARAAGWQAIYLDRRAGSEGAIASLTELLK